MVCGSSPTGSEVNMHKILYVAFAIILGLSTAACPSFWADVDTPEKELASAELTFQGIQATIQSLGNAGVITADIAPCVKDANKALHAGLQQSRISVKMGLGTAGVVVSAFRAALTEMRDRLALIKSGDYVCLS